MRTNCLFDFDHLNLVYYSGEEVNAHIRFSCNLDLPVDAMKIRFVGMAKSSTKSRRVNSPGRYRSDLMHSEVFLEKEMDVFREPLLPAGIYDYQFNMRLPDDCPTSLVAKYGKITYILTFLAESKNSDGLIWQQPITVLKSVDLNASPEYRLPSKIDEVKYLCCCCCLKGPILTTLCVPHSGYASGQKIEYALQVENNTSARVQSVLVELVQKFDYSARKDRYDEKVLSQQPHTPSTTPSHRSIFHKGTLAVPAVSATMDGNSFIKVNYEIRAKVVIGRGHTVQKLRIPITIGTVPLMDEQNYQRFLESSRFEATAPPAPVSIGGQSATSECDLPPSYYMLEPPSYEQAVTHGDLFEDPADMKTNSFIPKYPTFPNYRLPTAPNAEDEGGPRHSAR